MNEMPDRLLRDMLQAPGPADPQECLDAGTAAAWAEDTLGRDQRRAAEAHAADCGRCQALIVAMARTAPPAVTRSWWRTPVMGWLVPLTGAAAALLVWMSVPETAREPSSTLVSNAIEQLPSQPPPGEVSRRRADTSRPPPAKPGAAKTNNRKGTNAPSGRSQGSAADNSSTEAPAAMEKALSEAARGPAAPTAPMAPPATAASPPPREADADAAAAALVPVPPVAVQRTAAQFGSASGRGGLLPDARRPPTVIVSPNRTSQWRILANGAVQRSTDGGAAWELQATGVAVMLTAGASPAPSICWLVGPQGIVLLSTDGRSWRRIAFPETVDLAAVRATDDMNATVNTSDGRTLSTTDGGRTWTR